MRYAIRWAPLYARYGALAGYLLAAAVIAVGWLGRDQRNIDAEQGLGYALGLAGGLSMLVLLQVAGALVGCVGAGVVGGG